MRLYTLTYQNSENQQCLFVIAACSAIYGIVKQPSDFASFLLAIFIVNLLMYFAFYIIMKVRPCNSAGL